MDAAVTAVEVLGRRVELPVEVRSARSAAATFVVRRRPVRDLIAASGLEPLRLPGDRTVCILAVVQYVDNDLGAYNEVAVAFPVRSSDRPGGAYIHQLPVDGEFTCAAGRDIWGFPKWIGQIDLSFAGPSARCRLEDDGELVLDLQVRPRPLPLPARASEMQAYASAGGSTLRTPFTARPRGVRGGPGGARLRLGERHPMARELRALGLPRRALISSVVTDLSATFSAAQAE